MLMHSHEVRRIITSQTFSKDSCYGPFFNEGRNSYGPSLMRAGIANLLLVLKYFFCESRVASRSEFLSDLSENREMGHTGSLL